MSALSAHAGTYPCNAISQMASLPISSLPAVPGIPNEIAWSRGPLKVFWDCYLPGVSVDCQEMERSFFEALNMLKQASSASGADISIKVRSISVLNGNKITMDFGGTNDLPSYSLNDTILSGYSPTGTLVRIMGDLEKGMAPFLGVVSPAEAQGGILDLQLKDPNSTGVVLPPDTHETGWYVSPALMLNFSESENKTLSGNGGVGVNYSNPSWRVTGTGYFNYSRSTVPTVTAQGQPSTESVDQYSDGGNVTIVRSLPKGFNIAVLGTVGQSPQSQNLQFRANGSLGVEWTEKPFLETNDSNLILSYMIGEEYQNYVAPNVEGKNSESFPKHSLVVSYPWHFTQIDLNLSAEASSPVESHL